LQAYLFYKIAEAIYSPLLGSGFQRAAGTGAPLSTGHTPGGHSLMKDENANHHIALERESAEE
jgi:hypothetical protein